LQLGRKSEKLDLQIEQLELPLEGLQSDEGAAHIEIPETARNAPEVPQRKLLPEHLPRETRTHRRNEIERIVEAACWAHARRQIYELHATRPNAFDAEALERIGALYESEEVIHRRPPNERRACRQAHAKPLLDQLRTWLSEVLEIFSRKSDTSRAILYARNRWAALTRYCDDGRLEIDNLPVEHALRGVAIGRRIRFATSTH